MQVVSTRAPHPKSVANCKACQASVSQVCIQHAGGQVPKEGDDRRCKGTNKAGIQCRKWSIAGEDHCLAHQPDHVAAKAAVVAPGKANSDRRKLERTANEHLMALGRGTGIDIDALEELAALSEEAIELKDWLRDEMKKKAREQDADPRAVEQTLARYVTALDRAAKLVEGYGKYGLEKRIVEVREELSALVLAVFNQLLCYVPEDQQPAAIITLQRTVAAIEQPKALSA